MWCDTKKCGVDNSLHVAILWVIWLHRSHSFFNRVPWSGLQFSGEMQPTSLLNVASYSREEKKEELMRVVGVMEHLPRAPPGRILAKPAKAHWGSFGYDG